MVCEVSHTLPEAGPAYLTSSHFSDDLSATRQIWSAPLVVPTAGMMIFTTYLAIPELLAVQRGAVPRVIIDIDGEREFLCRMLGLNLPGKDPYGGGIANPRVRAAIAEMRVRHFEMARMKKQHMDFMARVTALAPIHLARALGSPVVDDARWNSYWTYVRAAMGLLGADLGSMGEASVAHDDFIARYCGPSPAGQESVDRLRGRYPQHFDRALNVLPDAVRAVVTSTRV